MDDSVISKEWISSFIELYTESESTIVLLTDTKSDGQLAADAENFIEAYTSLNPIYTSLVTMPKAPERNLKKAHKNLVNALSMCIKAAEMLMKMIDDVNHNAKTAARMHLASVMGYVNYADIYFKECKKRLIKLGLLD